MTSLVENRKARKEYTILETLEAGIVLSGHEVKALRAKRASITEAFIKVLGGEAFLVNARVEQLSTVAHISYEPTRSRKLLLHRKQVLGLEEKIHTRGLTAVPLSIGTSGNFIKVLVGIGKGKKTYERKEELKRRDLKRETERAVKKYR